MDDGKIHIPARKSQLSMKQIASLIIMQSLGRIVYDKEE